MDNLNTRLKEQVEQIAFAHTMKVLDGASVGYFMIRPHFTLKPVMKTICARRVFRKTASTRTRKYLLDCWLVWEVMPSGTIFSRAILTKVTNPFGETSSGRKTHQIEHNRGYNKYLKLSGEISIEIDYEKYNQDKVWDGLKGYVTNTRLSGAEVMENYKNLWHIEKAFRAKG